MKKIYDVTCGTDDKYAQHCLAMLCSLFENNKEKSLRVHILINSLSENYRSDFNKLAKKYGMEILFHTVDDRLFDGVQFKRKRPLTNAAYYRIKLPSILPEVKTVLYLDCDMIVLGDIDELFNINLDGYALAACNDPMPYNDLHRRQLNHPVGTKTFCSGVMYINLEFWREKDIESKCMTFAKTPRNPLYLHDQDVFNFVFKNQWYMLPPKWNVSPCFKVTKSEYYKTYDYVDYDLTPCIYHFYDRFKPWQDVFCFKKDLYLKYLNLSGCSNPYVEHMSRREKFEALRQAFFMYFSRKIKPFLPWTIIFIIHELRWLINFPIYIFNLLFSSKNNKRELLNFFLYGND